MNVIKKTVVVLFVFILTAWNTNKEISKEQNTSITNSLRIHKENSIIEVVIQFREHISETQRVEIRNRLISEGIIIDYEIVSPDYGIIIIYIPCDDADKCVIEMGKRCPCITPFGDLEDDGVINILSTPNGGRGQN